MNRELVISAVRETMSTYRALVRWLEWCHGLSDAKEAAGLYKDDANYGSEEWIVRSVEIEKVYIATNKPPRMPSKTKKYQMYDNAYRAARLAGVEISNGSISNLEQVLQTMILIEARLATS